MDGKDEAFWDRCVDQVITLFGYGRVVAIGDECVRLVEEFVKRGIDASGLTLRLQAGEEENSRINGRVSGGSSTDLPYPDSDFETVLALDYLSLVDDELIPQALFELSRITNHFAYVSIKKDERETKDELFTKRNRLWWEKRILLVGFRIHPLSLDALSPEEIFLDTETEYRFWLEKIVVTSKEGDDTDSGDSLNDTIRDKLRSPISESFSYIDRYNHARPFVREGDRVLDLECLEGSGDHLLRSGTLASKVLGLDSNECNVSYAKSVYASGSNLSFDRFGYKSLFRFDSGSFDVLLSIGDSGDLQRIENLSDSAFRILTPGGRFIFRVAEDESNSSFNIDTRSISNTIEPIVQILGDGFILEKILTPSSGELAGASRLVECDIDREPNTFIGSSLLVVAMKDPLVPADYPYRDVYSTLRKRGKAGTVVAFEEYYRTPWLLNAMVVPGSRLKRNSSLLALAGRVLSLHAHDTADYGAALCVLAYNDSADRVDLRSDLVSNIKSYVSFTSENPHVVRWQISLTYFLGTRSLESGRFEEALDWFERCIQFDPLYFSPHIATKSCGAAYLLGILHVGQQSFEDAKKSWLRGLELGVSAISSGENAIIGCKENPYSFGLTELEWVVDSSAKCAQSLRYLEDYRMNPTGLSRVMQMSIGDSMRQRDKLRQVLADSEAQTKRWRELCREAELQRDDFVQGAKHWEDLCHQAESQIRDFEKKLESEFSKNTRVIEERATLEEELARFQEVLRSRDKHIETVTAQLTVESEARRSEFEESQKWKRYAEIAEEAVSDVRGKLEAEMARNDVVDRLRTQLEEQIEVLRETLRARDIHIEGLNETLSQRDGHVHRLTHQLDLECDARGREKEAFLQELEVREASLKGAYERTRFVEAENEKLERGLKATIERLGKLAKELEEKRFSESLTLESMRIFVGRKSVRIILSSMVRFARRTYCFLRRKPFVRSGEEELKIAQINTHDLVGGAERTSFDLHTAFRSTPHVKADLIVGGKFGHDTDVHKIEYTERDWKPAAIWRDKWGLTEILYPTPLKGCFSWPHLRRADIVHIHNMHGQYWNSLTLGVFAFQKPVVLTLHDEYTLTGDCCFTNDCEKWRTGCGNCPRIGQEHAERYALGGGDLTRLNVRLKRAIFNQPRAYPLVVVSPSEWLAKRARRSKTLKKLPILRIQNGIDLELWKPMDQEVARSSFEIPAGKRIGLIVASNLNDPRKGFDLTIRAIEALPNGHNLHFLIVGKVSEELKSRLATLPVTILGFVDSKERMRECYCVADFVVVLSRFDNLPYTCIEALACGRPVLGTKVGGIGEIITNETEGWLVPRPLTVDRVVSSLIEIEKEPKEEFLGRFAVCRQSAEARFSLRLMKNRYLSLYNELRESARKGRPLNLTAISYSNEGATR